MSEVILQRQFAEPLTDDALIEMLQGTSGCFDLHRVEWQESLLSSDRQHMLCHFRGPDAESVRAALRSVDTDMRVHWPSTVHDAPDRSSDEICAANVLVLRSFDEPVTLEDLQAIEDDNIHCLETHRVRFMRTFFSTDHMHMACLYEAPDSESVRIAQRQAGMPFNSIWAFQRLAPDMFG
ncbi:MAG: DUF4242 domain-containing protein [Gammaproteobacteria bacterium]|jgi:hypothetical protein|nr:DUF4242 domain-containing protein [Gammaproteobacteria bacterium]MDH3758444.1 DUF4242 domain-containing protein [Gammaproteobacteria bacterium]MDH3847029.1 DUF4242 domain-containing protein [Gammaproteobacteria bacterium]MDH3864104.1 DUF4242 domain-containing protein [Gammaproteobacteria bacterium]MDH3905433.1 DUF4242 domain-containing protein [Gammaproteobacteria bacterium]